MSDPSTTLHSPIAEGELEALAARLARFFEARSNRLSPFRFEPDIAPFLEMDSALYGDLRAKMSFSEASMEASTQALSAMLNAALRHSRAQEAGVPEGWRKAGPAFNRWAVDAAAFVSLIQAHPMLWHCDSPLKYLGVRIDTRDGAFFLTDRDGKDIDPDRVLVAIRKAVERFGDGVEGAGPRHPSKLAAAPPAPVPGGQDEALTVVELHRMNVILDLLTGCPQGSMVDPSSLDDHLHHFNQAMLKLDPMRRAALAASQLSRKSATPGATKPGKTEGEL